MLATSFQLITRLRRQIVSHFATHAMWLVCIDILKIVNWKCTVSVEIHNNSSLSSGSRYCKPEVISWWKVNITVFYTRFLSPTDQKCAESSAFWQFFYYCPPSIQRERSLKCDAKNSTYIYQQISIHIYRYRYRYRYHPLDKRYGFSISVQPEITSLLSCCFFNVKKKCSSKVGRSVISWRSG